MTRLPFLCLIQSLLLIGPQALAHEVAEGEQADYHYEEIGLFDSQAGESKAQFMVRVAQGLLEFTGRTGFEGCGMVQEGVNGGWRVRLTTISSQVTCLRVAFNEEGYIARKEFIHSHPANTRIVLNKIDARATRRPEGEQITVLPNDYSPNDINNGGGWLVVPKFRFESPRLLYRGERYSRVVKKGLEPVAAPMPETFAEGAYVLNGRGQVSALSVARAD